MVGHGGEKRRRVMRLPQRNDGRRRRMVDCPRRERRVTIDDIRVEMRAVFYRRHLGEKDTNARRLFAPKDNHI